MTTNKQDDPFSSTAMVPAGHQFFRPLAPAQRTRQLDKAERWIAGESHSSSWSSQEQARKPRWPTGHRRHSRERYRESLQASADAIWRCGHAERQRPGVAAAG